MSDIFGTAPAVEDDRGGKVGAWSFSVIKDYETCPRRVYYRRVKRVKGVKSEAATRGTVAHAELERYMKTGSCDESKIPYAEKWLPRLEPMRSNAVTEPEWGFDSSWRPTGWWAPDVWGRIKPDVVWIDPFDRDAVVVLIDFKTGRSFGNEMAHRLQMLVYATGAAAMYAGEPLVRTELWYLDEDKVVDREYPHHVIAASRPRLDARARNVTEERVFVPRPSKGNCRFCDYNGVCPDADK